MTSQTRHTFGSLTAEMVGQVTHINATLESIDDQDYQLFGYRSPTSGSFHNFDQ